MMHSRIFQVSKAPVTTQNFIQAYEIQDHFQSGIADYVIEVENRREELDYLMESFRNILEQGPEKYSFRITAEGRENYFRGGYQRFRELCALMLTMPLGAFIGTEPGPEGKAISMLMYELNEAYADKYGYYIYEDDELMPLCEWLRGADLNEVYYFGNVLDYHF